MIFDFKEVIDVLKFIIEYLKVEDEYDIVCSWCDFLFIYILY